jgi:intracellular multiplication protein IcmO
MRKVRRGLERKHEQDPRQMLRDTRTFGMRVEDFFKNPPMVAMTIAGMAAAGFIIPSFADILLLIGITFFVIALTRVTSLPFKLPMSAHVKDHNDPIPGTTKPGKSAGIYFIGNELQTNAELWFSNPDMRTHMLIFGSTGSGKTVALTSIAYNALLQGSGFIYVDGKGDNTLYATIYGMVRSMGREDDLLLVNFMTGARDIIGPQKLRLSNTMNPFCQGSSSMLSQLCVSLMDSGKGGGDGDMWKGRAISFVEALMKVMVAMRDSGQLLLDANTIRNYFGLERLEAMVVDKVLIRDKGEPVSLEGLPEVILEPITNYVYNLPGYNKERKGKQVSQVLEQHGFITMQLTRMFSSLADTYGHIIRTNLAEVDFKDIVLNRRILVVLLPALEKSPDELANLGKIIIASLKAMMAAGLGDEVEGEYHDLINRKPTNAPTPFLCILDEYGYYAVQGFAVVPAQARSLGFSVVFAGQDLPAFQKASKEEAASIGANTNIKICMKMEDPMETWEFFSKTAGEAYVTQVSGFQSDTRGVMNNYMDNRSAQVVKQARIDLMDLKDQREGEAHVFFKSTIIRASMFYADPPKCKVMRLNQFLKVEQPDGAVLQKLLDSMEHFKKVVSKETVFPEAVAMDEFLERFITVFETTPADQMPIDRAVAALVAFHETSVPQVVEEALELPEDELNIFTGMRTSTYLNNILLAPDREKFAQPILPFTQTREQTAYIERFMGKTDSYSNSIAGEIVKDLQMATHYPPEIVDMPTAEELAQSIDVLVSNISTIKSKQGGGVEDDTSFLD